MENIRHGLHLLLLSQKAHGWPCYKPLMYHSDTLTEAMCGRNISKRSAEKIAAAAGWAFTKAFTCTSADTLSARSQRHYHLMLSSMFSTAVRWQLMDSNPCGRVTPPKLD